MSVESPSFLRRALSRLTSSDEEIAAAELRQDAAGLGATPIAALPPRGRARVCGTLRWVTLRPRAGVPTLEAELYDGSGSLSIVWLGRRRIPGIVPGRALVAAGAVTRDRGRVLMFNPAYELRGPGGEDGG